MIVSVIRLNLRITIEIFSLFVFVFVFLFVCERDIILCGREFKLGLGLEQGIFVMRESETGSAIGWNINIDIVVDILEYI